MPLGLWRRGPTARALAELREDVRQLAAAVHALDQQQAKDAKRMRQLLEERDTRWRKPLDEIERHLKAELKWRTNFSNQLAAVVRRLCLPIDQLDSSAALGARRFHLRSQNEEDGILLELLERAGWGHRRFVEIGSGATGGNAALLAYECGWSGLMIELAPKAAERARVRFAANAATQVLCERVTPENVNVLLERHGYATDVDLLSIDIDSYDYWVFEALRATPRVLMLEYNARFGPDRRVTIPRDQPVAGAPKGYGGASLAALTDLASRKAYRLVVCEDAGVNAFFLREDVAPDIPAVPVGQAFKPLRDRSNFRGGEVTSDIYEEARAAGLPLENV